MKNGPIPSDRKTDMISKKILEVKRNHHFVQADYLKHWSTDDINIWEVTPKRKVSKSGIKGVAKKTDFYAISEITEAHSNVIMHLMKGFHKVVREECIMMLREIILFQNLKRRYLNQKNFKDEQLEKLIKAMGANYLEEDHTSHELDARDVIKKIINNPSIDILHDDNNILKLHRYIGHQTTRTNKFRSFSELPDADYSQLSSDQQQRFLQFRKNQKECWWLISHFLGINLGWNIFSSRQSYNHCIVVNKTSQDFITSDHPATNAFSGEFKNKGDIQIEEFDLMMPLSPKVAYVLSASKNYPHGTMNVEENDIDIIEKINIKISENCEKTIFGLSELDIKKYIQYTKR